MAWTQTDLDAIEAALVNGTTTVKYSDKQVTYRSIDELIRVRELIRKDLGLTNAASGRVYASHSKGLNE